MATNSSQPSNNQPEGDGKKEISNESNDGYGSPYFNRPFLRKPSGKDLRLHKNNQSDVNMRNEYETSENKNGIQSDTRGSQHGIQSDTRGSQNGIQSDTRGRQNGNQSANGLSQNGNQLFQKKLPPMKPPRTNKTSPLSDNNNDEHVLSDRTLSYVCKPQPSSSTRRKPSFTKRPSPDKMLPLPESIDEEQNDPDEIPLYPWRTGAMPGMGLETGLGMRHGMGLGKKLELGLGSEFELSMEPRNMSRQAVRSPVRHNNDTVDTGPYNERDSTIIEDLFVRRSNELHVLPLTNRLITNNVLSNTNHYSFMESGVYDRLEIAKDGRHNGDGFLMSGDFDKLLPLEDPQTTSSSTQNHSTSDSERDLSASPTLGSSPSPPGTPITCSPKLRRHVRRRSEDLSELSVAKERQLTVSPLGLSPQRAFRRQSTFESPQLTKRYLSPGVEESMNWEFIPHGYIGGFQSSVNEEKRKRKWSIFGGDKAKSTLFNTKKPSRILRYVSTDSVDINATNIQGDTALHCYIKLDKPDKLDCILTFLIHCKINKLDINKKDRHGNTPLHLATRYNDILVIKILLAFGADMNAQNDRQETPLDLLSDRHSPEEIHELFMMLYALPGGKTLKRKTCLLNESLNSIINERYEIEDAERLGVYLSEERLTAFVFKLEQLLRKEDLIFSFRNKVDERDSSGTFYDPLIARENQGSVIQKWKSTLEFKRGVGSRVLFLDGGGIRGLIQIEVLALIEKMTGRTITDLFDWIVGTSTGGLLALCMVYAQMNLSELRQMYFQLREEVFSGGIMGAAKRTEAMEHTLKKAFKDIRMCDRLPSSKCPQVLISAVSTKTNPPRLHFFNNCFNNQYSQELVWKVARYTTAGPTYFTECDNYVDGGVMANNPCMEAWLEISKYYESKGLRPNFAMAVSIGTGIYPPEKLGEVDFFSKGLFDLRGTLNRAKKLIKMLSTALVESERVAEIFSRTCETIETSFFRFSPALSHSIRPDETDAKILVDMVVQTQMYLHEQSCKAKFDKMIRLFKHITEISRGLNLNN